MTRQFMVIGLGQLGFSMVATLDSLGHEVLGIDIDEDVVQTSRTTCRASTWSPRTPLMRMPCVAWTSRASTPRR
ncbi:MAG TPA: NAD-binding protein [Rubrobacter sp.]